MGDSTCFMQPFCYASGISSEANENNPIHALGQSISFGRFMTESLAWEKWSSFSHNRYVEEAERYSKPGSVAQKKAFFEAHYKKLAAQKAAAAALLEQANKAAENKATRDEDEGAIGNESHSLETSANCEMVVKEEQDAKVEETSLISERNKVEETELQMEEEAVVGNSMKVELQNQLEDGDSTFKEQSEKLSGTATPTLKLSGHIMTPTPTLKVSSYDQEILASTSKKKPPVTSFKFLKANGTSNFTSTPIKSIAHCKKDDFITPMSNKPSALNNADKKRYTPKSLQMSVNFTPIKELNRFTASVMRKFESTKIGASSSKASKDSLTPLRTPTMASKEMQKQSSLTPLTEKRNKTPIDSSASRNHTAGPKWRLLSGENKMRSPIISSPFSLRTEERAARRKKKLEEKFNDNVTQKVQLHTKLKEKAGTEIRKLRQSFCFQARPLPDFYKERKASKIETRQVPLIHLETPNEERKFTNSISESKTSLPPNRPFPSMKNNNGTKNFQVKSGPNLTLTTHENTSPNIQNWKQNDRNYK